MKPIGQTAREFADITLNEMKRNFMIERVGPYPERKRSKNAASSGNLYRSLKLARITTDRMVRRAYEANNDGGTINSVEFTIAEYARFIDIGAGRGYKAEAQAGVRSRVRRGRKKTTGSKFWKENDHPRRVKPFMMAEIRHHTTALGNILLDRYGVRYCNQLIVFSQKYPFEL